MNHSDYYQYADLPAVSSVTLPAFVWVLVAPFDPDRLSLRIEPAQGTDYLIFSPCSGSDTPSGGFYSGLLDLVWPRDGLLVGQEWYAMGGVTLSKSDGVVNVLQIRMPRKPECGDERRGTDPYAFNVAPLPGSIDASAAVDNSVQSATDADLKELLADYNKLVPPRKG